MHFTVRSATVSDSSAVRQLLLDLSHHCPVTDFLLRPDFSVEDLQQHRVLCYLCFETTAQLPVGLCIASRTYYAANGHILIITGVYVDPGHRRRGICSAMIQAILRDNAVKDIILQYLEVEVPESEKTAQIAFETLGFVNFSTHLPSMSYKLPNDAYEQLISKPTRPGVSISCLGPCEEEEKNSAFKLRLATPEEDIGDILRFLAELGEMEHWPVTTNTDALLRDMNNGCFSCVLVEDTRTGRTVGQCLFTPFYSITHGESGRITGLFLETEYRGKGLGGALIQACCQVAKSQGIEFVDLHIDKWNEGGRKVYEHLGFVKDALVTFSVVGENLDRLRTREEMPYISLE